MGYKTNGPKFLLMLTLFACKREEVSLDLRDSERVHTDDVGRPDIGSVTNPIPVEISQPAPTDTTSIDEPGPTATSMPQTASTTKPSYSISENENVLRCPAIKSYRREDGEFQIIHKAIGTEVQKGTNVLQNEICKVSGKATIPAGYIMNLAFKSTKVDTEPYLHKDDSSVFYYTLKNTVNGADYYSKFLGSIVGIEELAKQVNLERRTFKAMTCNEAKAIDSEANFSVILDFQLTSKIVDPDDTVGNFIITTPTILVTFQKCN